MLYQNAVQSYQLPKRCQSYRPPGIRTAIAERCCMKESLSQDAGFYTWLGQSYAVMPTNQRTACEALRSPMKAFTAIAEKAHRSRQASVAGTEVEAPAKRRSTSSLPAKRRRTCCAQRSEEGPDRSERLEHRPQDRIDEESSREPGEHRHTGRAGFWAEHRDTR